VFLAALAAARIEPRLVGGRLAAGYDLLMAAAAASLVLEGRGMLGVPHRAAVRARMAEAGGGWGVQRAGTTRDAPSPEPPSGELSEEPGPSTPALGG
jgi:hypothetical protein